MHRSWLCDLALAGFGACERGLACDVACERGLARGVKRSFDALGRVQRKNDVITSVQALIKSVSAFHVSQNDIIAAYVLRACSLISLAQPHSPLEDSI